MRAKNKAENSVVHTAFIFALEDVFWGSPSLQFCPTFAHNSPVAALFLNFGYGGCESFVCATQVETRRFDLARSWFQ